MRARGREERRKEREREYLNAVKITYASMDTRKTQSKASVEEKRENERGRGREREREIVRSENNSLMSTGNTRQDKAQSTHMRWNVSE